MQEQVTNLRIVKTPTPFFQPFQLGTFPPPGAWTSPRWIFGLRFSATFTSLGSRWIPGGFKWVLSYFNSSKCRSAYRSYSLTMVMMTFLFRKQPWLIYGKYMVNDEQWWLLNGVPDMGVPPIAGWFTREDSTKMDDKNGGSPILGHSHVFLGGDIKVIMSS